MTPSVTVGKYLSDWTERSGPDHLAQHVLHDPAVAVVVRLPGRVDPDDRVELDLAAVRPGRRDLHRARGVTVVQLRDPGEVERLGAVQAQRRHVLTLGELERQHTHA